MNNPVEESPAGGNDSSTCEERETFPSGLCEAERERYGGRDWRVGVALSGGGIRSATLSLGIFQAMAREGLLGRIDYLSTVSGGGYFGSFLGQMFRREEDEDEVRTFLSDNSSPPLRLLRENGCYVAPRGAPDLAVGATVALRNLLSVHVVMGVFALFLFSLLAFPRFLAEARFPDLRALSPVLFEWIWVSPYMVVALVAFFALAVPPGWAYWLVRDSARSSKRTDQWGSWMVRWAPVLFFVAAGALVGLGRMGVQWGSGGPWDLMGKAHEALDWPEKTGFPSLGLLLLVAGAVAFLTIAAYLVAPLLARGENSEDSTTSTPTLRRVLSQLATVGLTTTLAVLVVGIVDTSGQSLLLVAYHIDWGAISLYAVLLALLPVLRPLVQSLLERDPSSLLRGAPGKVLLSLAVGLILLVVLSLPAMVAHWIALGGVEFGAGTGDPAPLEVPGGWWKPLLTLALAAGVLSWFMGRIRPFVNRSTLHAIYEARLRRAYMGASNPERRGESKDRPPVTRVHEKDGATLAEYYRPPGKGAGATTLAGPVHLINVTVNQTVGGRSQIERRDRKGMGMAVGPGGISVGARHHARWTWEAESGSPGLDPVPKVAGDAVAEGPTATGAGDKKAVEEEPKPFRVFERASKPEALDIGHWIAVSGAAFSTGLGSRTSMGLSFLAGLFNVRLGYWWDSGLDPSARSSRSTRTWSRLIGGAARWVFPVQVTLLDEWFGRFSGVDARSWYLSDGGHFENMGAYELIRRRLPFIIICDNEADPGYTFSGLSKLVRKARTDFGADIEFLDEAGLANPLRPTGDPLIPELNRWVCRLPALQRGRWTKEPVVDPTTLKKRVTREEKDVARLSLGHAALARITYAGDGGSGGGTKAAEPGILLYIKPTLVGDEPIDVLQYHAEHPAFPHEPTSDQFFDEEQWESYRRLGEHMGKKLFGKYSSPGWSPRMEMGG